MTFYSNFSRCVKSRYFWFEPVESKTGTVKCVSLFDVQTIIDEAEKI